LGWVDIDKEPEIAKLYGVTKAPAFGIAEGTSITMYSGANFNAE
jgi:thioredoxin-like negative regulator of GroEL